MVDRLLDILNCTDSRHFAKLWLFYRDSFSTDNDCLDFLHSTLHTEPVIGSGTQVDDTSEDTLFLDQDGNVVHNEDFISRRMLNAVERLVTAARDMEQIRRGKDIFKIVYIVTCVETLQNLKGLNSDTKKKQLFTFFEGYTPQDKKVYIAERFKHDDEEVPEDDEDSFKQFVGVLNEYRNAAAHEGEYWEYCFSKVNSDTPMLIVLDIDLDKFSSKDKKRHCFHTLLSYNDFERIFIQTCIAFICDYVANKKEQHDNIAF